MIQLRGIPFVVLSYSLSSAAFGLAQAPPVSAAPARIVMPSMVDVPLVDVGGRPAVEVTINGKGPYRFLVETGSQSIRISETVAKEIGLRPAAGGDQEYAVDSMNIGEASFKNFALAPLPPTLAGMVPSFGVAGFLGLPFYHDVLLTLDYPAHRVRFERDTLPDANGADVLSLSKVNNYYWGVPILIDGKSLTSVLDTQNSGTLGIDASVAASLAFAGEPTSFGNVQGVFGTSAVKLGILRGDVQVGRYRFRSLPAIVTQLPPGFPRGTNMGARMLTNFVVSLDQRHARLRLTRASSEPIVMPPPAQRAAPAAPPSGAPRME